MTTQVMPQVSMPAQMMPAANWMQNPAFSSMVTQAMNSQRPAAQKFYLWLLEEGGWPTLEEYSDMVQFVDRIKSLIGQPYCLCPFMGFHLTITNGPMRYLQTPMGPIPLFDVPDGSTAPGATFGWVGPDMDVPQPPMSDTEDVMIEEDEPQHHDLPEGVSGSEGAPQSPDETPVF
jgi:hypothetical protein